MFGNIYIYKPPKYLLKYQCVRLNGTKHDILELSVHSGHLFPVTMFSRQIATFSRRSRNTRHGCVTIRHNSSREKTPIAKIFFFCFISFTPHISSSYFPLSHTHINYKKIYYFCPNCHFRSATCPSNIALVIFAAFKSSLSVSVFPCNDSILVSHFFFLSFISSLPYCLPIIIVSNILKCLMNIPFSFWLSSTHFTTLARSSCT